MVGKSQERRCFVVAEHLSHYRFGVYSILDSCTDWRFTFVGGANTLNGGIEGIPPDRLSDVRILRQFRLGRLLWQRGLVRLCFTQRPDAVIFVGDAQFLSSWLAALVLRLRHVPVLFWTIGWHKPDHGAKRVIRLLFYRLANKLLLYGSDGAAIGRLMGYPDHRMEIIGNSYRSCLSSSDAELRGIRDFEGLLFDGECVGAVSRLTAEKRFDLLIEAVRIIRSRGRDLSVVLIGAGDEEQRLHIQAAESEVPLLLLGPIYAEEALDVVYQRLSVTVLPERAGLAVIQSLSHGTPVVSADDPHRQVPEFRAIKNGVTGSLYSPGRPEELAMAIENCADLVIRSGRQVEEQCRQEVAENWSPEKHAMRILRALSTV